jgi:type II secretion system protein I
MNVEMEYFANKLKKKQDGFTLVEVLCALGILGIIAIGLFSALGTSLKATSIADEQTTAKNLAESQMEYVKKLEWNPDVYSPDEIPHEYQGYEVTIDPPEILDGRDEDLQKITVKVFYHGEELMKLEGYKLK